MPCWLEFRPIFLLFVQDNVLLFLLDRLFVRVLKDNSDFCLQVKPVARLTFLPWNQSDNSNTLLIFQPLTFPFWLLLTRLLPSLFLSFVSYTCFAKNLGARMKSLGTFIVWHGASVPERCSRSSIRLSLKCPQQLWLCPGGLCTEQPARSQLAGPFVLLCAVVANLLGSCREVRIKQRWKHCEKKALGTEIPARPSDCSWLWCLWPEGPKLCSSVGNGAEDPSLGWGPSIHQQAVKYVWNMCENVGSKFAKYSY